MGYANLLSVTTARIDDVVLVLYVLLRIGLPKLLNEYLLPHWR